MRDAFTSSGFGSESVQPPVPPAVAAKASKPVTTPVKVPSSAIKLPTDPSQQTEMLLQALAEARAGDPETLSVVSAQLVEQIKDIQQQNEVSVTTVPSLYLACATVFSVHIP